MGHWYTPQGEPRYDATLREARKEGLFCGITDISRIKAAPALVRYQVMQAVLASLTTPLKRGESDEDWVERILQDSRQHAQIAAQTGNELHDAIENAVKGKDYHPKWSLHVTGVLAVLSQLTPEKGEAEVCVAHPSGYGGRCDWHSREGRVIVDFKTKEVIQEGKQLAFIDHAMQLAALRQALAMPDAKCYNIFISTKPPLTIKVHEWAEEELKKAMRMFDHCLALWKLTNNYLVTDFT